MDKTKISNADFGKRIGVTHSMASRIRNGQRLPSTARIAAIHREFEIPLDQLIGAAEKGPTAFSQLMREKFDGPEPLGGKRRST
jgi:transcriptional regulator with XRE-family HTH domain